MKNQVVVIGGGFTGAYVAKHLEKEFSVTLIDTKDYFEYTPGITRSIVTQRNKKIQTLHTNYLRKANIITGAVKHVTPHHVLVNKEKVPYDYLVLATGCRYHPLFPQQNSIAVERGRVLRNHHQQLLDAKDVLIVGGGVVGVETAGAIASTYPDKNVTIVHGHDQLIQGFRARTRTAVLKWLEKHHVTIIYDERIEHSRGKTFTTKTGKRITADLALFCIGSKPDTGYLKHFNSVDDHAYIKVDASLRLLGTNNIFVGGDVTNCKEKKLAQNAERHARIIVDNIRRTEKGFALKKYVPSERPKIIELGKWHCVFTYKKMSFSGKIPAFMKAFINWHWRKTYS